MKRQWLILPILLVNSTIYAGPLHELAAHKVKNVSVATQIDRLIIEGADINEYDVIGMTPLMYAASAGDLPLFLTLISKGADINQAGDDGESNLEGGYGTAIWFLSGPQNRDLLSEIRQWCISHRIKITNSQDKIILDMNDPGSYDREFNASANIIHDYDQKQPELMEEQYYETLGLDVAVRDLSIIDFVNYLNKLSSEFVAHGLGVSGSTGLAPFRIAGPLRLDLLSQRATGEVLRLQIFENELMWVDSDGNSGLHKAMKDGKPEEIIRVLNKLSYLEVLALMHLKNNDGSTPLTLKKQYAHLIHKRAAGDIVTMDMVSSSKNTSKRSQLLNLVKPAS